VSSWQQQQQSSRGDAGGRGSASDKIKRVAETDVRPCRAVHGLVGKCCGSAGGRQLISHSVRPTHSSTTCRMSIARPTASGVMQLPATDRCYYRLIHLRCCCCRCCCMLLLRGADLVHGQVKLLSVLTMR